MIPNIASLLFDQRQQKRHEPPQETKKKKRQTPQVDGTLLEQVCKKPKTIMTAEDKGPEAENLGEEDNAGDDDELKNRKRRERLEQNRVSARESRKRKKTMIEELQRTVITLSRENKDLNDRNETLRRQLMEIGAKYPSIVPLQAIMQGSAAAGQNSLTDPNAAGAPVAPAAAPPQVPAAAAAPTMVAFPQMTFWQQGQAGAPPAQPGAPAAAAAPVPQPAAPAPAQTQNV